VKSPRGIKHYFVDEAGDGTLFNAHGVDIVGRDGVSHTFMVGVAEIEDPLAVGHRLGALRAELLRDPYFRNVPSMRPSQNKTAIFFHAKDDLPEVRREVFRLISSLGVKFQVAIRRKSELVGQARLLHRHGQRMTPSGIYDDLVHRGESHEICFARRGKGDRQEALTEAIRRAKHNFSNKWKSELDLPFRIRSSVPSQEAGLQIVDYGLWAIQRLFERGEDRFALAIAPCCRLIMDLDDTRLKNYGRWYSDADPIALEKIKPLKS
jgi:hypothetical protein